MSSLKNLSEALLSENVILRQSTSSDDCFLHKKIGANYWTHFDCDEYLDIHCGDMYFATAGMLGQGDKNNRGDEPGEMGDNLSVVDLGADFEVDHVSCGAWHTCVLSTNNEIKCFGDPFPNFGYNETDINIGDEEGEMGDNLMTVNLGTDFVPIQVDCGWMVSCALSANSQVKCWGYDRWIEDMIGDDINEMGDNLTPIDMGSGFNVSGIACGLDHICAISTDQEVKCWGHNYHGQLGQGDTTNVGGQYGDNLTTINLGTDFVPQLVGVGWKWSFAVSTDGTMKAWGSNSEGTLGNGNTNIIGDDSNEMGDFLSIIDVGTGYTVTDVASGCCSPHACAWITDGADLLGLKWCVDR